MKTPMVDLSQFSNSEYNPGGFFKRSLWLLVSLILFETGVPFPSALKCGALRLFGAKVGRKVVIKPFVKIKYPWFLVVESNVWFGEHVWVDNLCSVIIRKNVCISQGAYLLTGSHDYKKEKFDLIVRPITLEEGVWVGAKAVVCPGVLMEEYSVLSVGSVMTSNAVRGEVYQGNPAVFKRNRY